MMAFATSSCLASSSSSSSSAPAPQKQYTQKEMEYLVRTKETMQGLRNRVLESPDVRRDLQVLGTPQEEDFLRQKEQIVRHAPSLQTLTVARIVASHAYVEFQKRAQGSCAVSSTALSQSTALMQMATQLQGKQQLAPADMALFQQALPQFQAQIQALSAELVQLPSLTPNLSNPETRKKVQTIFAAWIVQNAQGTVSAMRDAAKSVFADTITVSK